MKLQKTTSLLLSVLTLLLTSCSNAADTEIQNSEAINTQGTENFQTEQIPSDTQVSQTDQTLLDTETVSKGEILRFVDAWGEWHETEILSNIPKHNYDWDCLTNNGQEISYIGDENYTIRKGIDVSYYQGNIDWEKVKADGYEFAFLRIGYRGYGESGKLIKDSAFDANIKNAQAAGIDVGVYFFAQAVNEQEAIEEAEFVLDILKDYKLQLPIVYDPELIRHDEARTDNVTGEQFTKNTIAFCETVKTAGFEPMIYSNMVWEATLFDMEQLQQYPFWYADYEAVPQTPYAFTCWQYSESGSVNGIEGSVDLNIWFCPTE